LAGWGKCLTVSLVCRVPSPGHDVFCRRFRCGEFWLEQQGLCERCLSLPAQEEASQRGPLSACFHHPAHSRFLCSSVHDTIAILFDYSGASPASNHPLDTTESFRTAVRCRNVTRLRCDKLRVSLAASNTSRHSAIQKG
jgi:hypothetical protein